MAAKKRDPAQDSSVDRVGSSCLYGPVPSWRLGRSLGVDPIPRKTCNWNCVYCQLGRTQPVVCRREDYVEPGVVVKALRHFFETHPQEDVDWVTFVGAGEPLLHAQIGRMIRDAVALTGLPVAVITNGSLLYRPEVRREVSAAQAVLPSLDAGNPTLYRRLNRPHPEVTFQRHVDGLKAFRQEYDGELWIEVMLIRGLNDDDQALEEITSLLHQIRPDEIHINTPTRCPAEPWVEVSDTERVMQASVFFERVAPVRLAHATDGAFNLSECDSVVDGIIGIITRHPMSEEELGRALTCWAPGYEGEVLAKLAESGRARVVLRGTKRFWQSASSHFPGER